MIPLHQLLSRMRWVRIGYLDHQCEELVYVSPFQVRAEEESHFCFEVTDEDGVAHSVPYHRVKEVWKDGELIWHREH